MPVIVLARNPTDSVTRGLLPAAHRLGLSVRLLTDHPGHHAHEYQTFSRDFGYPPPMVEGCDVTSMRAVLAALAARTSPAPIDAIMSNSDHLQTQTAQAAAYFGLPGKDWRSAIRARDKGLMRARLHQAGLDHTPAVRLPAAASADQIAQVTFPAVLKPAEGVASEDVSLVRDCAELSQRITQIRGHRTDDLIAEGFLTGTLHTMETIGDGATLRVWGGYSTTVSPPPNFIEERLTWNPPAPAVAEALRQQLAALGIGFGACHTEYMLTENGPVIVEVNDRLIGDRCDFAMAELLGEPVFEDVIRLYLGQATPAPARPPSRFRAGLVESVVGDRPGRLIQCPSEISTVQDTPAGPVKIGYHSLRAAGSQIELTGSNRDFLGLLTVLGPDPATVGHRTEQFLREHTWSIE